MYPKKSVKSDKAERARGAGDRPKIGENRLATTILAGALAAVTAALGLLLLMLVRELILDVMAVSGADAWAAKSVDNISLIGLALIWLAVIIYSQHYYARGAGRRRIWRNFARISAIQLVLLVAVQLFPVLLGLKLYGPLLWLLICAEGAAVLLLIVLSRLPGTRAQ